MYGHNSRFKTPNLNRGPQPNDFRGQYSNDFRGQGQYPNDYLPDYPSQSRHRNYGQGNSSHFQYNNPYNSYRPMNHSQNSQNNYEQTSGHPQRSQLSPHERGNPPRNQNHRSHQEKPIPYQDEHKHYICPGCSQPFDVSRGRSNRYFGRIPLVLNCQHTVCQECIHKEADNKNVICPVCHLPSELPNKEHGTLEEVFVPNFYIVGMILWAKPPTNQPLLVSATKNRKSVSNELLEIPEPEGEKCGFISCHKRAVLRCQDCNDEFCVDCCTMVHKNVKSMWSHVQVQITNGNFSAELEKCPEHGGDVELYCNTCDTGACCYCFIEKHGGHEKEYLSKLTTDELREFQVNKEKAEEVLKQLIVSKRKLNDIYTGSASVVEKKIYNYLGNLCGRIQLLQKKLFKDLSSIEDVKKPDNSIIKLISHLDRSIRSWKNVLAATEIVDTKKINLRGILNKLRDVDLTPCYLLNEGSNDAIFTEFCPDPVLENLEDLFTVKQCSDYNLQLVSSVDLPPDYVKDPADSQIDLDIYGSNSSNTGQSSMKEESNMYNKRISSQSGPSHPKEKTFKPGYRKKFDKKSIRGKQKKHYN